MNASKTARRLFAVALAAGTSTACALLADIPDSVTVTPDNDATDGKSPQDANEGCVIHVRALNATDSPAIADVAIPQFLGAYDYLREIGETGGIRGCKLEWHYVQTEYTNPAKAVAIYEEWKRAPDWDQVIAIFGVGSADALALGPKVSTDKKVLIPFAYNGTLASPHELKMAVDVPEVTFVPGTPTRMNETTFSQEVESKGYPYVFFTGTDYSTAIRVAMYHLSAVDPGARVGFVHCAANEFCLNPLPPGKTYAKQLGLAIGRDLLVELTDRQKEYGAALTTYFGQEAAHALSEAANGRTYRPVSWLWAGNLTAGTALLAGTMGYLQTLISSPDSSMSPATWAKAKEIMSGTRIIANNYGFDESLVTSFCPAMPVPKACGKIFGIMPFLAFGDTSTAATEMQRVLELHDKWRARDVGEPYSDASAILEAGLPVPTTRSVRYVQGYMSVKFLKMGVERMLDLHLPITGENLKTAFETFQSEDTGGLTAPLTFTADDHRPQSTVSIYGIDFSDAGAGSIRNVPPPRRIALQHQWLGW